MPQDAARPDGPLAELVALAKQAAPYAPAAGGALLSMMFGEKLTALGKAASGVVGMGCAVFLGPATAAALDLPWPGDHGALPDSIESAVVFLWGLFGMAVVGGLAPWLRKVAGDPLKLVRVQIGPVEIGGDRSDGSPE